MDSSEDDIVLTVVPVRHLKAPEVISAWFVRLRSPGGGAAFGPFGSEADARAAALKVATDLRKALEAVTVVNAKGGAA